MGRTQDSIDRMKTQCKFEDLPIWNNELYLEFHRGCQTTQAHTKRNNRKCEFLLRQTEFLNSWALVTGGKYDQQRIYDSWKIVLTNQFHDILPGSSITEVYTQAAKDYAEARSLACSARADALRHLAGKIDTAAQEGVPVVVFNGLSWGRTDIAQVSMPLPKGGFRVIGADGNPVLHQQTGPDTFIFAAGVVPPMGYSVFHVVAEKEEAVESTLKASPKGMENAYVRIKFDKNGSLSSVYDKTEGREVLAKGQRGNILQLFDDHPHNNDAWDIDPNFEDILWEPQAPVSIDVVEEGPVRAVVRIVRKTERSVITQDVTLYVHTPRVDFVTHVDWHEKHVLFKASFPVAVRSSHASYEVAYATIERATHHNTAFDRGRFEVPAHKWADLSEGDYGVSLLNDCKYGYDVKDNVLRISLLRATCEPDPVADQGEHQFTYSLFPHAWDWRGGTVEEAFELNDPLLVVNLKQGAKGALPTSASFASLDADNVVIDTVKRCEDSNSLIVRVYEAYGQRGDVNLTFGRKPKKVTECDLMEENDVPVKMKGSTVSFFVTPFEIRTFKVTF